MQRGPTVRAALPPTARVRCLWALEHAIHARTDPSTQDFREVVKEENPGITFGEIGKKLGAKWAEVDEKTKKARAAAWRRADVAKRAFAPLRPSP
jgi:hypothetical protein